MGDNFQLKILKTKGWTGSQFFENFIGPNKNERPNGEVSPGAGEGF